ncbi:MAG: substrate-binding domain-containing protein, partial [Mycobacteriaceae bacterium]
AGIQTLKDRDSGFKRGLAAGCPGITIASTRYSNNDLNTAASQVNDALTANPNLVGIFADNNTSGDGAARAIKDNNRASTLPVVAFAEIGVAVALGVLLDTLVVRSVLVTALNLEMRGRMWWPGALAKRDASLDAAPTGIEEAGEEPAGAGALEPAH